MDDFNIVIFSDVHSNHRKTTAENILGELTHVLTENGEALGKETDLIGLTGDFFDRMLEMPTDDFFRIIQWVRWFVEYCHRHDILLRVLEGTGSHDYGQSKIFIELGQNIDVKYVDTVSVEYIEKLGIHVLYVPDEVNADATITYGEVKRVLGNAGIDKVDYAFMHGFFEFQIPTGVDNTIAHNSGLYHELVRRYVFIGHHHSHQIFKNICVPGSFSRLRQGEEEAKGYVICQHRKEKSYVKFRPNHLAKTYETIDLSRATVEEALQLLGKLGEYRHGSEIRLIVDKHSEANNIIKDIRGIYPHVNFDISRVVMAKNIGESRKMLQSYHPISLKSDNIVALVDAKLGDNVDKAFILSLLEHSVTSVS